MLCSVQYRPTCTSHSVRALNHQHSTRISAIVITSSVRSCNSQRTCRSLFWIRVIVLIMHAHIRSSTFTAVPPSTQPISIRHPIGENHHIQRRRSTMDIRKQKHIPLACRYGASLAFLFSIFTEFVHSSIRSMVPHACRPDLENKAHQTTYPREMFHATVRPTKSWRRLEGHRWQPCTVPYYFRS